MNAEGDDPVLERYRSHAETLGARFNSLSSQELYAPVAACFPPPPASVLDVGAGSGRDAAWLAGRGYRVVAVEPVAELARQSDKLPGVAEVEWVEDRLPELASLPSREAAFDLVLLSGVWHHVAEDRRPTAMARLRALMRPGGCMAVNLRHGPGTDETHIYSCDPDRTVAQADRAGLTCVLRRAAPSVQPGNMFAGVTWTWLVLQRPEGDIP